VNIFGQEFLLKVRFNMPKQDDLKILWDTIELDLPPLIDQLENIIKEEASLPLSRE